MQFRHLALIFAVILCFPDTLCADLDAEKWRQDLEQLDTEFRQTHKSPFHSLTEAEWSRMVSDLNAEIPGLDDQVVMLRMAAMVAAIGDGHTRLTLPRLQPESGLRVGHTGTPPPHDDGLLLHRLPVTFYWFADGLFITEAIKPHSELIGCEVTAFGETPTAGALQKISPLVHRDNDYGLKDMAPDRLAIPELLQFSGIVTDAANVELSLNCPGAGQRKIALAALKGTLNGWVRGDRQPELALAGGDDRFWHRWLNDGRVLYVHLYEINDKESEPLVPWFGRVLSMAAERRVERLIIDLRRNYGGDSSHNRGLVMALKDIGDFDQSGKTYVLIGRSTFSAAQNLVGDLEQWTRALLVGEPTGASPGSYGDSRKIRLKNSGLTVRLSTRYHQDWLGPIGREASLPDISVPIRSTDWFAGLDAALSVAMAHHFPADPGDWYRSLFENSGFDHATVRLWQYRNDPFHAQQDFSQALAVVATDFLENGRIEDAYYTALLLRNLFPESSAADSAIEAVEKARATTGE